MSVEEEVSPAGGLRERLRRSAAQSLGELRRAPNVGPERGRLLSARVGGEARPSEILVLKGALQERLLDALESRDLEESSASDLSSVVEEFVRGVLEREEIPLNARETRNLVEELVDETLGIGPLAPLMSDPAITDILVNGPEHVYVERFGRLERTDVRFRDADHVVRVIERIATRVGRRIDAAQPMVDLRLPDGSRVNATIPPASPDGPTLSIRRFGRHRIRREELLRRESVSKEILDFLAATVKGRRNLLISGGTGAGKSTLLGALAEVIPARERIVTIEDTLELLLDQDHWVRLETRPPNVEGRGIITARDLVINSLRMRPDRIIVGEVRGGEALDMLQAMNTGHDGGLCTVHANSPRDALARLETMVLMAGFDLPSRAIREQMVSALDLVVHVRRYEDGVRRIESVAEVVGLEGETPLLQDLFRFERHGLVDGRVRGSFVATGIVPRFAAELRQRGLEVDLGLFRKGAGANHA